MNNALEYLKGFLLKLPALLLHVASKENAIECIRDRYDVC